MIPRVTVTDIFRCSIDVRKESDAQQDGEESSYNQLPILLLFLFFLRAGSVLPVEERLQILHHEFGQTCEHSAPAPEFLERERREQNCERGKIFSKAFPTRNH